MNRRTAILTTLLLAACASKPPQPDAFDDYVAVSELPAIDKINTGSRDNWKALSDRYLIYKSRRGTYLFVFSGRCPALLNPVFDPRFMQADIRYDRTIRPRIDTIRGCTIGEIYAITPEQIVELENIGEAPGPR